ncbi:MAG: putative transmembrane protein (PGPGW) [Rhodobacteraceae bacterium HLUCCA12]|nr:MAG: putative transmembrane protein (PGPGW) [Rhodobacteraceae bacterium HLUCCA12]
MPDRRAEAYTTTTEDGAHMADRHKRRLDRQLRAMARSFPAMAPLIAALHGRPGMMVRLPVAFLLLVGGLLGFLPILGFWMIPLGLLILAIDMPALRPVVSAAIIRIRRRWKTRRHHRRRNNGNGQ